jgi:hypothetical protein
MIRSLALLTAAVLCLSTSPARNRCCYHDITEFFREFSLFQSMPTWT